MLKTNDVAVCFKVEKITLPQVIKEEALGIYLLIFNCLVLCKKWQHVEVVWMRSYKNSGWLQRLEWTALPGIVPCLRKNVFSFKENKHWNLIKNVLKGITRKVKHKTKLK